jgi:hypothetical protein
MSFTDEKKEVIYIAPMAWFVDNGYIPRHQEFKLENCVWVLKNWKQGDFFFGLPTLGEKGTTILPK